MKNDLHNQSNQCKLSLATVTLSVCGKHRRQYPSVYTVQHTTTLLTCTAKPNQVFMAFTDAHSLTGYLLKMFWTVWEDVWVRESWVLFLLCVNGADGGTQTYPPASDTCEIQPCFPYNAFAPHPPPPSNRQIISNQSTFGPSYLQVLPCSEIEMQRLIRLKFHLLRTIFESVLMQTWPPSVFTLLPPNPQKQLWTLDLVF